MKSPRLEHTSAQKLRVGIVDPLPLFRAGVAHTLMASGHVLSTAECRTAAEAQWLAREGSVDVMLIDPFAIAGGAQIIPALGRLPSLRLMIMSTVSDANSVAFALRHGASGYMLKTANAQELVRAVVEVSRGESYLTPSLGAQLFAKVQSANGQTSATGYEVLTAREKQILTVLSRGATNKEIATELKIAEATVKFFMTNIMQKLQVRNRVEAVLEASRWSAQAQLRAASHAQMDDQLPNGRAP